MPQFDTFIFSSSLVYFIISFFVLLYINYNLVLPTLASVLKLRYKLLKRQSTTKSTTVSLKTNVLSFTNYLSQNN